MYQQLNTAQIGFDVIHPQLSLTIDDPQKMIEEYYSKIPKDGPEEGKKYTLFPRHNFAQNKIADIKKAFEEGDKVAPDELKHLAPLAKACSADIEKVLETYKAAHQYYDAEDYTTASQRFLVQELIREQVFLATEQEIPYGSAVVVDRFVDDPARKLVLIGATILVERANHKGILIGKGGQRLKSIGQAARTAIEALLGRGVFLELYVRVEPGWSRKRDRLAELEL